MNSNQLLDILKTAKSQVSDKRYAEALQTLESALDCNPEPWLETEIHFQAAICRCELDEYVKAADSLQAALSLAGDMAYSEKKHIYDLLRTAYAHIPDYVKLAELCRMLIHIEENKTGLLSNLILACCKSGKWDKLALTFDDFPDIDSSSETLLNKTLCFTETGRYKDAFRSAGEYIERFGEDHKIFANLMYLCNRVGDSKRCFEYYKKAIALCDEPAWRLDIGQIFLFGDLYKGAVSDGEFPGIINDMRRSTEKLQINTVFGNSLKPFRKIKLGYLSADFRKHPVGYFLLPVMMSTSTSHCFNYCFNLTQPNDECDPVTAQFKSLAHKWEEVYGRPDSYIEQLFLKNTIDIAFDMMCHTENNRLMLYARRLAPVQISWIGSPVTTGVAAMDYVITDKNVDPPGSEKYYTEKLLYMPDCFLCTALSGRPQIEPPAFIRNGDITFACFHNLYKVNDKTLGMWRRILENCGNSRLKIMGLLPAGEEGREMLNEQFRKIGLPMDRVSILPMCDKNDYFAAYNDVDIMLDTYPFSGATTTFDALRMGRPIITLAGERHVTRVSYSLLKHVGLDDLAAFSEDEYVEKAVMLASSQDRLRKINTDLPQRFEDSPLTNQPAFRKNYEKIIRDAWVNYCFENRAENYDYSEDSPQELLEQAVNSTVYLERILDADECVDGSLADEYYRVQKAFCEKLATVTKDEEFIRGYERLVRVIERQLDGKNIRPAISRAMRYLNTFCSKIL